MLLVWKQVQEAHIHAFPCCTFDISIDLFRNIAVLSLRPITTVTTTVTTTT